MSLDQPVQPARTDADRETRHRGDAAAGWRAGALTGAVALAANLTVLVAGNLAGADMSVLQPGADEAMTVGPVQVVATSLLPVALATGVLVAVRRRAPAAWRFLATAGLVVGVLSIVMPLAVTATGGTKATLAVMHLVTGAVWFLVVRRAAGQLPRRP